ncbi:lectin C-type domain protein [Talaromyces proteolyticus]|uniref:Maintenance of telomere capping protein 6 n=1 Tax=Talaromyces proteolyticus TaxID=1131652 RepID=A0AAD4Q409_9EURO|nr:lectin C-type domain protein [Talaromyces proteolyticus]KAH8705654.1 lectin C-type domain protein [Talaromyces proteolyticus]
MSGTYTSNTSLLTDLFWVNLLSQRDVSFQVPINYVTQPAIALTAACFGDKSYDGAAGSSCLSDLLTVGYRRFIVDIYWSHENQKWLLCPVSIPSSSASNASGASQYILGDYTCSSSFDVTTLTGVFDSYIQNTGQAVGATFLYIIFNLHAAADSDAPDQPPPTLPASSLPSGPTMLGSIIDKQLGLNIYTPTILTQERGNLNASWYADTSGNTNLLASYFITDSDASNIQSTPDGWPCEAYLSQKSNKRLLFGLGSVDSQMENYNFNNDSSYIFPADEVTSSTTISITSDERGLRSGCFFNPQTTDVSKVNSSWAEGVPTNIDLNTTPEISALLLNFTNCGISPILNQTLGGETVDFDIDRYRIASMSTMWSWAIGEPRNASGDPQFESGGTFRCAFMDTNSAGHWKAGNCSDEYRAACRVDNQPYSWILSENSQSFSDSAYGCPENSSFDVPRTGLENTYLYDSVVSSVGDSSEQTIWINMNSMQVQYCWVLGGTNSSCPYSADPDDVQRRTILIPTIAAIVVLIITVLIIFVKCNSNRISRRRKRVIEGWEYEGVPS